MLKTRARRLTGLTLRNDLLGYARFFYSAAPNTGYRFQGFVAEDVSDNAAPEDYEAITCIACQQVHLVNPKTGRVLGSKA